MSRDRDIDTKIDRDRDNYSGRERGRDARTRGRRACVTLKGLLDTIGDAMEVVVLQREAHKHHAAET
jgi:hypothetical protein